MDPLDPNLSPVDALRPDAPLQGKRVLLGVTGGIAAYKSPLLVRRLQDAGAEVDVIATPAALEFVTPLTLATLSGRPVRSEIFDLRSDGGIAHTSYTSEADVAVVAPASADFIGRLAGGLADQLLLTALMASHMPVVLAPSMNVEMWDSPLFQRNLALLRSLPRYQILEPGAGYLACRVEGKGRMPEPDAIVKQVIRALTPQDLAGRRVVVTAGPTRERFDPVRFFSNRSTGLMGYALAEAAAERGADVTLIAGPTSLVAPEGPRLVRVESTADLLRAVLAETEHAHAIVMAAAPADYRPRTYSESKLKKGADGLTLELAPNPDILKTLAAERPHLFRLGFAAETHDFEKNAADKAVRKALDLIFVNDVGDRARGTGFEAPTNGGWLLDGAGVRVREIPVRPKRIVAHELLDELVRRLGAKVG